MIQLSDFIAVFKLKSERQVDQLRMVASEPFKLYLYFSHRNEDELLQNVMLKTVFILRY